MLPEMPVGEGMARAGLQVSLEGFCLAVVRKADNHWKIYDVEIEGVSILLTYRAQFDDILSRGTVEDLFARLAEKQPAR